MKSQPQIDTSSETVFSRLMSDLGGQIVVDKFRMTPRGYTSILCLAALFPRLLHPPHSRSPLKNVSRLAQSRRLVCFYTTDARPTQHAKWFKKLQNWEYN